MLSLGEITMSCEIFRQVDIIDYPVFDLIGFSFKLSLHSFGKVLDSKFILSCLSISLTQIENSQSVLSFKSGLIKTSIYKESESLSIRSSFVCVFRSGS